MFGVQLTHDVVSGLGGQDAKSWGKPAQTRDIKLKARQAAYRAVKSGEIKKGPCLTCGDPNSEAHHDDYLKPLDVRWFCRFHHRALLHPEIQINDEFTGKPRRDRRKEARRLRDGKCRLCAKPRVSKRYCERHLELRRQQAARWRRRKGIPVRDRPQVGWVAS